MTGQASTMGKRYEEIATVSEPGWIVAGQPTHKSTLDTDMMFVGKPYIIAMSSTWLVAVKEANGDLTFYGVPEQGDWRIVKSEVES